MDWKEKRRAAYLEKLKDPRWQKLRLEIFNRDEWRCRDCHDTTKTLNVHHLYYTNGAEPWEYPLASLITLCSLCQILLRARHEWFEDLCRANGFLTAKEWAEKRAKGEIE